MDPVRRRRMAVVAVLAALFAVAVLVAAVAVPALTRMWQEDFLRSPQGVPYSPEGAVEKTMDRLRGE